MTDDEDIREAIRELADDGKVPCKALLALADQLAVPPGRVGRLCDEMNVRIRACQLGCFQ